MKKFDEFIINESEDLTDEVKTKITKKMEDFFVVKYNQLIHEMETKYGKGGKNFALEYAEKEHLK